MDLEAYKSALECLIVVQMSNDGEFPERHGSTAWPDYRSLADAIQAPGR